MRVMIFRSGQRSGFAAITAEISALTLVGVLVVGSTMLSGCGKSSTTAGGGTDKGIRTSFDTARKSDGKLPPEAQKAMETYLAKQNGGAVGAPVNAGQKK